MSTPSAGVDRSMRGIDRFTWGKIPSASASSSRALAAAHVPAGSSSGSEPFCGRTRSRMKLPE